MFGTAARLHEVAVDRDARLPRGAGHQQHRLVERPGDRQQPERGDPPDRLRDPRVCRSDPHCPDRSAQQREHTRQSRQLAVLERAAARNWFAIGWLASRRTRGTPCARRLPSPSSSESAGRLRRVLRDRRADAGASFLAPVPAEDLSGVRNTRPGERCCPRQLRAGAALYISGGGVPVCADSISTISSRMDRANRVVLVALRSAR